MIRSTFALGLACAALGLISLHGDDWELAAPAPVIALHPATLDGLESYSCAECHAELVTEWASTAHGLAWVDQEYQDALEGRKRPEQCYECHIPEPLFQADKIAVVTRENDRHLGISCESCHLAPDGSMLGPRGTEVEAHASTKSEHMLGAGSNAMCIACHAKNIGPVIGIAKGFEDPEHAEESETCVGCHMAKVERSWANAPEAGGEAAPSRLGRSHALQTPRDPSFLRRSFGFSLRKDGSSAVLTIKNRAGHRIPGLVSRRIDFRIEALDEDGAPVASSEWRVSKRQYLAREESVEVALEKAGSRVRVMGIHDELRAEEPITFLDLVLEYEP